MAAASKIVTSESGRTILVRIPSFLPFRCWKNSRVGSQWIPVKAPIVTPAHPAGNRRSAMSDGPWSSCVSFSGQTVASLQ